MSSVGSEPSSPLLDLPVATILLILRFLDVRACGIVASVCRKLRDLVRSDDVWENMLRLWDFKTINNYPPMPAAFTNAPTAKEKVQFLQARKNQFAPFARSLFEAVEKTIKLSMIPFPQAKQLSNGLVDTGFRIFTSPTTKQASCLSVMSSTIIKAPPSVVYRVISDLDVMPTWNKVLLSHQKRAFVSNDMCMIELEFPVGRYVHLLAQDTSRGEDGFRLAWSADCPMSLVDAAGQPIVAGLVPGSLQPIATASSPFDERHRAWQAGLPEPAGGPLDAPGMWHCLPSGYVASRIDDFTTQVHYLNQIDARMQLNAHFVFRICGFRTKILQALRLHCEMRLPEEEQVIDMLCNWQAEMHRVRPDPPLVLPPLRSVLSPPAPLVLGKRSSPASFAAPAAHDDKLERPKRARSSRS
eukprot:TRINITY_DN4257_c0_g1_i1.p1 TRINITY_DN4257_c0_g1~~TRINITY_DN4257_c0_g1_i1.p1  ORF type:complete len:413 (-),score=49.78 TRINITY_DN4257_c0_g1_i1:443-1681(-)